MLLFNAFETCFLNVHNLVISLPGNVKKSHILCKVALTLHFFTQWK